MRKTIADNPKIKKLMRISTADGIRKLMQKEKIKGQTCTNLMCPLAAYFNKVAHKKQHYAVNRSYVRTVKNYTRIMDITSAMGEFIVEFDFGYYPELILWA